MDKERVCKFDRKDKGQERVCCYYEFSYYDLTTLIDYHWTLLHLTSLQSIRIVADSIGKEAREATELRTSKDLSMT